MKGLKFFAICIIAGIALSMASCNRASTPRVNLRTTVDSASYAWGVTLVDDLVRILEQQGILESVAAIEQQFDMRMMVADSLERITLAQERREAIAEVNRRNTPRLNEFIRGMKSGVRLPEPPRESPFAFGENIGAQLGLQMISPMNEQLFGPESDQSINTNQLLAGLIQGIRGTPTVMDTHEAVSFFENFMEQAQEQRLLQDWGHNKVAGENFLAENARRPGVVVLPSGLQYEVIYEGHGPKPVLSNIVHVHYHGTLIDDTVFDSSIDRGQVFSFHVGGNVIQGWNEVIQLMPLGSKWRVFIPYDLAYGTHHMGIITPFSALIFEIELLEIEN